jgi:hypothetical protein
LRHSGKKYNKRKGKNSGRGLIPNRVDIDQRPSIVAASRAVRFGAPDEAQDASYFAASARICSFCDNDSGIACSLFVLYADLSCSARVGGVSVSASAVERIRCWRNWEAAGRHLPEFIEAMD